MKRLTEYSEISKDYITPRCYNFDCNGCCIYCDYEQVIINKLAEYENTGLDPKEIEEKDQRIAELEKENKRLNTKLEIWNRFDKKDYIHRGEKATERDYYYYTNGVSAVLENEVERLKHDLAVRDKALRLLANETNLCHENGIDGIISCYLEQAEEALRKLEEV